MATPRKVWIKWLTRKGRTPEGRRYLVLRVQEQDGTTHDEGSGWATDAEAEEARARRLLGLAPKGSSAPGATVADVLGEYVADLERRRGPGDEYVQQEDRRCVHLGRHLGRLSVSALSTSHLRRYLGARRQETTRRGLPPSRAYLWQELRALKAALRLGRDYGLHAAPDLTLPQRHEIPDDARPARSLGQDEVAALLRVAYALGGDKIGSLFTVHAWSGRRPVAVHEVHAEDAAQLPARMFWRRDKAGVRRGWGPVAAPARDALEEYARGRSGPLWLTTEGGLYYPAIVNDHWCERLCREAGVEPIQLYDLRRFACTQIVAMTPTLAVAQQYTGHLRKETLLRYVTSTEAQAAEYADRIGWTPEPLRLADDNDNEGGG